MIHQTNSQTSTSSPNITIGIDWADQNHDFYATDHEGNLLHGQFEQTPQAIAQWIAKLQHCFPGKTLDICVEIKHGPLISGLLMHDGIRIFPINPLQLARYRESQDVSGRKGDPTDAQLLARFLTNYADKLRVLVQDDPQTRRLQILVRHRRDIVDQRTARGNELQSLLKQYFPLMIQLAASCIHAEFICNMLLKWPTLGKLKRVRPATLRKFFYAGNIRGDHVNKKLQLIEQAAPLTDNPVLLETFSMKVNHLARLILIDANVIRDYDRQIRAILKVHADYEIVDSLPGAALQMQSRIIAALGSERDRFESAQSLQCYSGIAPVSKKSGRTCIVHHRWACPKFTKQTFHEYASLSIPQSAWAKAYYNMMLSRGRTPQMAKRALAYKWQRIIFRCWQDRKPYCEARYQQRLREAGSPIIDFLEPTTTCKSNSAKTVDN